MEAADRIACETCYHCGLPNNNAAVDSIKIQGVERNFCCHGCRSVCNAILQAGFEQYYDHRSAKAATQFAAESYEALSLYDRPDIKREFVLKQDGTEQACLLLENIHCAACVWLNEQHIRNLNGVVSVSIDSATHRANVRWDPEQIALSEILLAIRDIGYQAYPFDPVKNQQQLEAQRQKSTERLLFAGIFGMFVMQFSMASYFMGASLDREEMQAWEIVGRWICLLLSFLLLVYPGQTFFISTWRTIRQRRINMDVPIVIGLTAAYLGSAYAVLVQHGEVYFDAIAMFIFFILISRRYELKGQLYAARYLSRLNKHRLGTADVIQNDGYTKTVVIDKLEDGDVVVVLPGAVLPIDARLASEHAEIDESLLTGESILQRRKRGDALFAGSINGEQRILLDVEQTKKFSTIDHINRLVLLVQEGKSAQEILINQIAGRFVAALLLVTVLTLSFWLWKGSSAWLANTIAVLIVTCPCALALSIPVANSISAGRMLELGILPLNMNALAKLATAKLAVFDKTGTLTDSSLALVGSHYELPKHRTATNNLIKQMMASSEHPIAKAMLLELGSAEADRIEVINSPGQGLSASVAGEEIRIGAFDFVQPDLLNSEITRKQLKIWQCQGYQIIAFSGKMNLSPAYFAFSNPIRQGSAKMIKQLRCLGVDQIVIASGDHEENVALLSRKLAADRHFSRLMPDDKLSLIGDLKKPDQPVIMIGDGINDAPTLAAADVAISLSGATDLAKTNSDFVLLGDDISKITQLRLIAQQTKRIIRQNIFWAISYNVIAIPAAAAGFVQPWIAALGMSLSALLVVLNSLRLCRSASKYKPANINSRHARQSAGSLSSGAAVKPAYRGG